MATPKKTPAKAAPAKAATKPRTRVKKVVEQVDAYTEPIQKDARKILGLPKWALYVIGGVLLLVLSKVFVIDGCKAKGIEKNNEKVEQLEQQLISSERAKDSLAYKFNELSAEVEEAIDIANQATDYRKETQAEGNEIRQQQKKITHEITKKILDPRTTDRERDAITDQLLRARAAAKMPASDTVRQPSSSSRRRYSGGN